MMMKISLRVRDAQMFCAAAMNKMLAKQATVNPLFTSLGASLVCENVLDVAMWQMW